ncbi:MAG: hypothetical protein II458_01835 [Oscillospiraceae bacterium]|nr:hypothetical protein [Oscillospiraceae bacterium]
MANIHCKACGTIYRYEKEGCCPNCGAYNRPPKRESVRSDGTVQHITDAAYENRQHARGKVCFEQKECHEEKVCYEDQARQGKRSGSPQVPSGPAPRPTGPVPHSQFPQTKSAPVQRTPASAPARKSPAGCLVTFMVVAILLAAVAVVAMSVLSTIGGW